MKRYGLLLLSLQAAILLITGCKMNSERKNSDQSNRDYGVTQNDKRMITTLEYGRTAGGDTVYSFLLRNGTGMEVEIPLQVR